MGVCGMGIVYVCVWVCSPLVREREWRVGAISEYFLFNWEKLKSSEKENFQFHESCILLSRQTNSHSLFS